VAQIGASNFSRYIRAMPAVLGCAKTNFVRTIDFKRIFADS